MSLRLSTVFCGKSQNESGTKPYLESETDKAETGRKGANVIMYGTHVYFVRERNGYFWLVDDGQPEIALRLPGVFSQLEAERLAWTLINNH